MSEKTAAAGDSTVTREPTELLRRLPSRREAGVLFGFVALYGLIAVTRPDIFFSWQDISGVTFRLFRTASIYVIIGMTFLIVSGEFDLSVGSMFASSGQTYELLIIAAVVIGGTNRFGGE